MGLISRVSSRTYRESHTKMQTSNFQSMKTTAQKWGGGPSWSTLPKSHLPDSKVWTIQGTPFEKLEANLKRGGYRFPWFRNEVWVYYLHKQNRPFESAMGRRKNCQWQLQWR